MWTANTRDGTRWLGFGYRRLWASATARLLTMFASRAIREVQDQVGEGLLDRRDTASTPGGSVNQRAERRPDVSVSPYAAVLLASALSGDGHDHVHVLAAVAIRGQPGTHNDRRSRISSTTPLELLPGAAESKVGARRERHVDGTVSTSAANATSARSRGHARAARRSRNKRDDCVSRRDAAGYWNSREEPRERGTARKQAEGRCRHATHRAPQLVTKNAAKEEWRSARGKVSRVSKSRLLESRPDANVLSTTRQDAAMLAGSSTARISRRASIRGA